MESTLLASREQHEANYQFSSIHLRSLLIISGEFVLGPADGICTSVTWQPTRVDLEIRHTNGTNDWGTTEVLRGHHIRGELGVPLQLHLVGEMIHWATGGHSDRFRRERSHCRKGEKAGKDESGQAQVLQGLGSHKERKVRWDERVVGGWLDGIGRRKKRNSNQEGGRDLKLDGDSLF